MMRVLSLARILRRLEFVEQMTERVLPESIMTMFDVVKLFVGIIWLMHLVSCVWFMIGAGTDDARSWTRTAAQREIWDAAEPPGEFTSYRFLTALHWSLSQISPGSMEVFPENTAERIFNVVVLSFGLLFVSSLVSSMSATMVRLQMQTRENTKKLRVLRIFLRQNNIKSMLAIRIEKQAAKRTAKKPRVKENEVEALEYLTASMRRGLHAEMYGKHLESLPFFRLCFNLHIPVMEQLCNEGVRVLHIEARDELFTPNTETDDAFFVAGHKRATMVYLQTPDSSPVRVETKQSVGVDTWVCEVALYCHWTHVGSLTAETDCLILALNAEHVLNILGSHVILWDLTLEYGDIFHHRVTTANSALIGWPDDLQVPMADFTAIVGSMHRGLQVLVGQVAVQLAKKEVARSMGGLLGIGNHFEQLEQEVLGGQSIVVQSGSGELERLVFLVTARVHRSSDDKVLYRVGKLDREARSAVPGCKLPGSKQQAGEEPDDAIRRIFEGELASLMSSLVLQEVQKLEELKKSKKFGLNTRYIKTTQSARICDQAVVQAVLVASRIVQNCAETLDAWCLRSRRPSSFSVENHIALNALYENYTQLPLEAPFMLKRRFEQTENSSPYIYAWLDDLQAEFLLGSGAEIVLLNWLNCFELEALRDSNLIDNVNQELIDPVVEDIPTDWPRSAHRSGAASTSVSSSVEWIQM